MQRALVAIANLFVDVSVYFLSDRFIVLLLVFSACSSFMVTAVLLIYNRTSIASNLPLLPLNKCWSHTN